MSLLQSRVPKGPANQAVIQHWRPVTKEARVARQSPPTGNKSERAFEKVEGGGSMWCSASVQDCFSVSFHQSAEESMKIDAL